MKINQQKQMEDYLRAEETDYAILINGEWGSGKTYYYEKSLKDIIINCRYEHSKDNKNKFKPLYISLHGIAKTEEIATAIFLALNKNLKDASQNKAVKAFGELLNIGLSIPFITTLSSASNLKAKIFNNLNTETWTFLNENCVLCFDDLERTKLNIKEVLGYINKFTEHKKMKVIIIANQKEILNGIDAGSYKKPKEKIIGRTVDFKPTFEESVSKIIEHVCKTETIKQFMNDNREIILNTIEITKSNNLRLIKRAI